MSANEYLLKTEDDHLYHVIGFIDGCPYDSMFFKDGALHGGAWLRKWDDRSWIWDTNDYGHGFHEEYDGSDPNPDRVAEIKQLPPITDKEIWAHIKDGPSVLDVNEKARSLNATTH